MIHELSHKFTVRTEPKLQELPWYVAEFIEQKHSLSPTSLLNYVHDYLIFFDWLIAAGYHPGPKQEVSLNLLNRLRVLDMTKFHTYLKRELGNANATVNRKYAALKSLFRYLSDVAEFDDLTPYLTRNVMAKVRLEEEAVDAEAKASHITSFILRHDEFEKFRQFVAYEFGKMPKLHTTSKKFHEINRERDTAIISLFLGSGLRVSELVGLNVDDVDLNLNALTIVRKGGTKSVVRFSDSAKIDLQEYLLVRKKKYKPGSTTSALFLPSQESNNWTEGRLTVRSVQKLMEKYAKAFGRPALSVHKLRHSFATRHVHENNNIPQLKKQLGHESIQTTMIYTHVFDDEMLDAVNNADC